MIETIQDIIEDIRKKIVERFGENLKCLILYGSWAKGTARKDSDIDILAVFEKVDGELRKSVYDIERNIERNAERERSITLVISNLEDFRKEKIPLYTAVKREGKVISGNKVYFPWL